ncbi:MAG: glycosyltransferase family 9 protein [Proteobacteria bacterium]|nr:glycosyltransferase family 9 protein [Pseudomonadota bacterium]
MAYFFKKLKNSIPKRLLISRTDRIGDFILSLPVFEALKREHNPHITVLCNNIVVPLLKNNPFVDEVIPAHKAMDQDSLLAKIKAGSFDALLVLVNDPFILDLLPELKHIPIRIGPLSKPSALFQYTHPVIQKRSKSIKNEAEYNLELLKVFNFPINNRIKPRLYLSEKETQAFLSKHKSLYASIGKEIKWIALHPGMNDSALNMEAEFYADLLSGLLNQDFLVWLTGAGKKEFQGNQHLIKGSSISEKPKVINSAGIFDLRELAILLSRCKAYIGPSTGPTHLANAVGTPLVSFYPPIKVQSARRWEPFLSKGKIYSPDVACKQKFRCKGEKCKFYYCMDTIKANDVLEKVVSIVKS